MDDEEEKRPLGRPPSGGVNLNIVATGRGQGRPKKTLVAYRQLVKAENGGTTPHRKRGRPASSGKGPYQPTGKPRGRPKTVPAQDKEQDEIKDDEDKNEENGEENDDNEKTANNSGDDGDDVKMISQSEEEN